MANTLVQFRTDEINAEIAEVKTPKAFDDMTAAELNAKLEHSYAQSLAAEGRQYGEAFDDLERGLR